MFGIRMWKAKGHQNLNLGGITYCFTVCYSHKGRTEMWQVGR